MDTRFLFALMYEQATAVVNAAEKANNLPQSKKRFRTKCMRNLFLLI